MIVAISHLIYERVRYGDYDSNITKGKEWLSLNANGK